MLVFDGDCAFCTSSAHWIQARLPESIDVVPWQRLDLDALHMNEDDVTTAAYWVDPDGTRHRGHRGIAHALMASTSAAWCTVGRIMLVPPISWIGAVAYSVIAKNRHRMPGATPACAIPEPSDSA
jgi:predicted DCC family thiol-disulfide oxidoreductase YuxK